MAGGIVPSKNQDAINFFTTRLPLWAPAPTTIGITTSIVTQLATLANAAQTALDNAIAARAASKNATVALNDAMTALRKLGGDAVISIRAYAETTNNPSVYTIASIPPVSPATPTPPPEQPQALAGAINNTGAIVLSWQASRAVGTQFIIQRQMVPLEGTAHPWVAIATSTTLEYSDTSVPVGFRGVNYRVYAQRASGTSNASTTLNLVFGNQGSQQQGQGGLTIAA